MIPAPFDYVEADSADAVETARQHLQETLLAVFVSLGLLLRRAEDGGVWIEPLTPSRDR